MNHDHRDTDPSTPEESSSSSSRRNVSTPDPFVAVGCHYRDFRQTSDEEVIALLRSSRRDAGRA